MKGVALSVNMVIVLLMGLIVLSVVASFVMGQISSGEAKGMVTYNYYSLCAIWRNTNCDSNKTPSDMSKACKNGGLCENEVLCSSCISACCGSDTDLTTTEEASEALERSS